LEARLGRADLEAALAAPLAANKPKELVSV
jgi:hypothetical protein